MATSTDFDLFSINAASAGTLTLTLDVPTSSTFSNYFELGLYSSNGTLLSLFSTGQDKTYTLGAPAAGTYYIGISAVDYYYNSGQYSLSASLVAGSASAFESEANNTRATADALTLGSVITGQLSSASDVDWFQASVATPTVLNVNFDAPTNSTYSEYFRISICDAAGNLLSNQATGTDKVFSFNAPSAGSYYAVVWAPDYYYNSGNYSLTITQAPNSGLLYESENNDTTGTADALIAGNPIHGQLSTTTDLDYYALTLNSSGKLHVAFDSPTNSSYTSYFQLIVKDAAGNVLAGQASGSDMLIDKTVNSAGTYYVGVAAGGSYSHSTAEYALTVSAEVDIPIPVGTIVGTSLAEKLAGTSGDDSFAGNGGSDQINGGAGIDVAYFVTSQSNLAVSSIAGLTAVRGTYAAGAYADSAAKLWNIETIRTSNGDVAMSQPAQPVAPIFGTAGADTLSGTTAADVLDGLGGSDMVDGGAGSDTLAYFANKGQFSIETVAGVTRVKGGGTAAEYANTSSYVTNVEALAFQQGETTALPSASGNVIYGSAGADHVLGTAGDDIIVGRGGADIVRGGSGSDTLVFFAPSSEFTIQFATGANTQVTITGAGNSEYAGKIVTAEGIETLAFTDRAHSIVAVPGLVVASNTLTLAEGGSSANLSISLATAPTSAVTINVTGDAQVSPATTQLTFNAQNWNVSQTASVSAVNDTVHEGAHSGSLTLSVSTTDGLYGSVGSRQITYAISDNDSPTTGAVTGLVWGDSNHDALVGASEGGLAGWTVFDDANRNGKLDSVEKSAVTDASGHYAMADLAPGTHTISIVQKPGWVVTYPHAGSSGAIVISPTSVTGEAYIDGTIGTDVSLSSVAYTNLGNTTHIENFHKDPRFANIDGRGYAVVVIDSGIDLDHPFFGPDANGNGVADRVVYQYDFSGANDASAQDGMGHGTHVASIIGSSDSNYPGIAPGVNLIVLKVFSDGGGGASWNDIAEASQWVVANATKYNIVAVNMSLGSGNYSEPTAGSPIARSLAEMGVTIVAASGNSYRDYQTQGVAYPSSDPFVLSIGATWMNSGTWGTSQTGVADAIAIFSQRDTDQTDAFAPGVYINAAKSGGGNTLMSGTSMAAPEVSGMVVLAQQLAQQELGRRLTFDEVRNLIQSTGTPIIDGDNENDNVTNTGSTFSRIDMLAMANAILAMKPPLSQQITVTAGQTTENANFGFAGLSETRGLASDDVVVGTASGEQISGMGGADVINALGGDDIIFGNEGDDMLLGGAGTDQLDGGSGNDTASYENLSGGVIVRILAQSAQKLAEGKTDSLVNIENLSGSTGNDELEGDALTNRLAGGAGNDTLRGLGGNDDLDGGAGVDIADYSAAASGVVAELWRSVALNDGQGGQDALWSIEGVLGSPFNDLLAGGANNEVLVGGAGNDGLYAADGNDTLAGGAGNDTQDGGPGIDLVDYGTATGPVTAELWRSFALVDGQGGQDALWNIEALLGSAFNDILAGGNGNDSLSGAAGNDGLYAGNGNDTLIGGTGNDTLDGGANIDTADYSAATSAVTAELWRSFALNDGQGGQDALWNIERLIGSAFNDLLAGGGGNEFFSGGAGNDGIYAAAGIDTLVGGAGNDTLDGGPGIDVVDYSAAPAAVTAELWRAFALNDGQGGQDALWNIEGVIGSPFNDLMAGGANNEVLVGNAGNDGLYAADGIDTLMGGAGNDTMDGGPGIDAVDYAGATGPVTAELWRSFASNDGQGGQDALWNIEYLLGSAFADLLAGTDAANYLGGREGADQLYGAGGSDTLAGGLGNDTLNGGAGLDVFLFDTALGASNVDQVQDFVVVDDTLALENAVFTALASTGTLGAGLLRAGAGVTNAADGNDFILYNSSTGALFYDADGSGTGSTPVQFATLGTGLGLTVVDFVVV